MSLCPAAGGQPDRIFKILGARQSDFLSFQSTLCQIIIRLTIKARRLGICIFILGNHRYLNHNTRKFRLQDTEYFENFVRLPDIETQAYLLPEYTSIIVDIVLQFKGA